MNCPDKGFRIVAAPAPKSQVRALSSLARLVCKGQEVAPALLTDASGIVLAATKDAQVAWPDASCPVFLLRKSS